MAKFRVWEQAVVGRYFDIEAEDENAAIEAAESAYPDYDEGNLYPSDWELDAVEEIDE